MFVTLIEAIKKTYVQLLFFKNVFFLIKHNQIKTHYERDASIIFCSESTIGSCIITVFVLLLLQLLLSLLPFKLIFWFWLLWLLWLWLLLLLLILLMLLLLFALLWISKCLLKWSLRKNFFLQILHGKFRSSNKNKN